MRVWPWTERDKTPLELCGENLEFNSQILSETNVMRVSFYVAAKAVGATGFRAVWTEVRRREICSEREYKCKSTRYDLIIHM